MPASIESDIVTAAAAADTEQRHSGIDGVVVADVHGRELRQRALLCGSVLQLQVIPHQCAADSCKAEPLWYAIAGQSFAAIGGPYKATASVDSTTGNTLAAARIAAP